MNTHLFRRARRGQDDSGFAMVTVIGIMLVLTLFVVAATTFAVQAIPQSRRAQDYAAAMAAAQAGVDDVLSRLNSCDTYWSTPCVGSPPEPGRWDGNPSGSQTNRWAAVPGSAGSMNARYRYTLVSTPATTPGLIRVQVDGEVNGVRRTITADLRKPSFLNYIYYTNFESPSPTQILERRPGFSRAQAQACAQYYYDVPPARRTVRPRYCDINFIGGDVIRGPLYSNDALLLMAYRGQPGPLFQGNTETYWQQTFNPGADPAAPYRRNYGGVPHPSGRTPVIADKKVDLPASNNEIRVAAETGGCVYEGPTRVQLYRNGTVRVTSPLTSPSSLNPGCSSGGVTPLPPNGVIFVKASTAACTGKPTAYPLKPADVTPYDCNAGTAFVEGTLQGALTLASEHDIIVTDDLTYNTEAVNPSTGAVNMAATDVMGLVAQGFVRVYNPVDRRGNNLARSQVRNMRIDAAVLSVQNSFTVQNYHRGRRLGNLTVAGGIYQNHRGPVGTSSRPSTGYFKNYLYDTRLRSLPPPHFLNPVGSAWGVAGFSEG